MIKLIDYNRKKDGECFYISKDNIGDMKRRGNVTLVLTKNYEPTTYKVKETPEEILVMPDIEASEKVIDWEQRRYELVKDFISARIIHKEDKLNVREFMELHDLVDVVIDNLKKNKRQ